jgi:hypothetical protein
MPHDYDLLAQVEVIGDGTTNPVRIEELHNFDKLVDIGSKLADPIGIKLTRSALREKVCGYSFSYLYMNKVDCRQCRRE